MIQSQSEELDDPKHHEEIRVRVLLPEANPLISKSRLLSSQLPIQHSMVQCKTAPRTPSKRTRQNTKKNISPIVKLKNMFDGNFQCGNLQSFSVHEHKTFILKIKTDTNSKHHSQWFYFRVQGIRRGTFILGGFKKTSSLFNNGMKPCICENGEWKRGGYNVLYEQAEENYQLRFDYTFSDSSKISEIAFCFPYTFSDLQQLIKKTLASGAPVRKDVITKSMMGNDVVSLIFGQAEHKPVIILMSRVHPSQTVSSFVIKGLLDSLCSGSEQTKLLLNHYQIIVVPMLNPDGVKEGNSRFSFAGADLNRKWKTPSSYLHPQIFNMKRYIGKLGKRVAMIIDLHGHSRKKGVFFYGCSKDSEDYASRQFPYLMSKISPDYNYQNCCFSIHKSKQSTARVHLWNCLKIPYIYTLECTFAGRKGTTNNYEIADLQKIGSDLLRGIIIFFSKNFSKAGGATSRLFQESNQIKQKFNIEKQNMTVDDQDGDGSDSSPSQGQLPVNEVINLIETSKKINSEQMKTRFSVGRSPGTSARNRDLRGVSLKIANKGRKHEMVDRIMSTKMERKTEANQRMIRLTNDGHTSRSRILNNIRTRNELNLTKHFFTESSGSGNLKTIDPPIQDPQRAIHTEGAPIQENKPQGLSTHQSQRKHFFGPQYIRIKKYTQKLRYQQERLELSTLSNPSYIIKYKVNYQIVPLQVQKQPLNLEITLDSLDHRQHRLHK